MMKLGFLFLFCISPLSRAQSDSLKHISVGVYIGQSYIDWKQDFSQTAQLSFQFQRHFISFGPEFKFNFREENITNNGLTLNYRFYPLKSVPVVNPFLAFSTQYFVRKDARTFYGNTFTEESGYLYSTERISNNRRKSLQFAVGFGMDINVTPNIYFSVLAKYCLQWDEELVSTEYILQNGESQIKLSHLPDRWMSLIAQATFGYRLPLKKR